MIKYKTSSPAGDLISYLAGIRQMWKETGSKAVIYQQLNVVGVGIQGIDQPFKNERGDSILMGREMFDNLKPLIESQEYVESFLEYKGEEVDIDFDKIRNEIFVNQPLGSLNRYFFYAFPQMACDLSEAWISVKENDHYFYQMNKSSFEPSENSSLKNKAVINFTHRYRNTFINYFFLKKYQEDLIFIGLEKEHKDFTERWGLGISRLGSDSFLNVAEVIKNAKFFLGCASVCYQIAEALKVPRILETFQLIPNVIPVGKDAYDAYHQSAIEFYVDKLMNR